MVSAAAEGGIKCVTACKRRVLSLPTGVKKSINKDLEFLLGFEGCVGVR